MAFLQTVKLGYFGKVPTTGDFVGRNVDRALRDMLDQWLQAGLLQSRGDLGENWLHSYLTSPIWRFLIGGGDATVVGIMIPSVDKAGRYFPFAVLGQGPGQFTVADYKALDGLLDEIEPMILSVLEEDFDLDSFGYQLANLNRKLPARAGAKPASTISDLLEASRDYDSASTLETMRQRETSIWWTRGSEFKRPERMEFRGLPAAAQYSRMLRDEDILADLEIKWRELRDLALTQADNGSIEGSRRIANTDIHFATHPGHRAANNCAYARLLAEPAGLIMTDGRFGTRHNAMAARFVCTHLPAAFAGAELEDAEAEASRITAFLKAKVKADQSSLLPPLSFVMACALPGEPGRIKVIVAGEYLCLKLSGSEATQLFPLFSTGNDATTIRKVVSNQFLSFESQLADSEALVIASPGFAGPQIKERLSQAVTTPGDIASRVHAGLEAVLLQGGASNLAIGIMAPAAGGGSQGDGSELKP